MSRMERFFLWMTVVGFAGLIAALAWAGLIWLGAVAA